MAKWAASGAAERAELCDGFGGVRPSPSTGDPERHRYVFERKVPLVRDDSDDTLGSSDLYKHDGFILESKQASGEGASKLGKAKRGTPAWSILMKDAMPAATPATSENGYPLQPQPASP